jgi:large subunit ribosomal protein L30
VSEVAEKPKTAGKGRKSAGKTLTLRQVKSGICAPKKQKATLQGLGFRRMGQRVVRPDNPATRGMVLQVRHLVEIVED